jgi:hypothetical protein
MPKGVVQKFQKPEPKWHIGGSYVLDVLFGVNIANDIDVCCLSSCREPTYAEIRKWFPDHNLSDRGLPIQIIHVKQLELPEAGGYPTLNIDFWRLEMDGKLYQVDSATGVMTELKLSSAGPLQIVKRPVPRDIAENALRKMNAIPQLNNPAIRAELDGCLSSLRDESAERKD